MEMKYVQLETYKENILNLIRQGMTISLMLVHKMMKWGYVNDFRVVVNISERKGMFHYAGIVFQVYGDISQKSAWYMSLLTGNGRISSRKNVSTFMRKIHRLTTQCQLLTIVMPGLVDLPKEIILLGDRRCLIAIVKLQDKLQTLCFTNKTYEVEECIPEFERIDIKLIPFEHTPGVTNIAELLTQISACIEEVCMGSLWWKYPNYL